MSVAYKGEIELPTTLYTGDGIELEKGRFEIEIRSEKGLNFLVFLRKGELISLVNGKAMGAEVKPTSSLTSRWSVPFIFMPPLRTSRKKMKSHQSRSLSI